MNFLKIFKFIAVVELFMGAFMLIPTAMALGSKDYNQAWAFLSTIAIILLFFFVTFFLTRKQKYTDFFIKEGFFFVTFSWLLSALFGSLPFVFSGVIPSFVDAYFESASGFSTTGASILTNVEIVPQSILFWRSLTHWLGGMGIVVLIVAILPSLGIGGTKLIAAESPGPIKDKFAPRAGTTAKVLWGTYLGLSLVQTILLLLGGMTLFDSLTHMFATMGTGGFSTKNASVGHFTSPYLQWVIILFMFIAGVNFVLIFKFLSGRIKEAFSDIEFRLYIAIIFLSSFFIVLSIRHLYPSTEEALRHSFFQVLTIITTTGFMTTDYELWPYFAQAILFIAMFIGACSGSTGGGVKVIRILTLFKVAFNELKYMLHPRGVFVLRFGSVVAPTRVIHLVSGFFLMYIFTLLLITLIVTTANVDLLTAFSTSLATLGNIGPGFGLVGPTENYAFYPDYVKMVLSFAMLVGRLELFTVFILLTRIFWR